MSDGVMRWRAVMACWLLLAAGVGWWQCCWCQRGVVRRSDGATCVTLQPYIPRLAQASGAPIHQLATTSPPPLRCHVMEREAFEDPAIAAVINQHFVAIKVDREERPDVDRCVCVCVVCMYVCVGGGGGGRCRGTTGRHVPCSVCAGCTYPA